MDHVDQYQSQKEGFMGVNKKEALAILKPKECSETALNLAYYDAVFKYSIDNYENRKLIDIVNLAYEKLKNNFWTPYEMRAAAKTSPITECIQELYSLIKQFDNVKCEIIGSWIWVSGKTTQYKEYLKEWGFKYSWGKRAYYWCGHEWGGWLSENHFTMRDIRNKFGTHQMA